MNIGVQFSPICIWFLLHSQKVFCNLKLCINSWWLCEIHDTDQNNDPFLQPLNPQCYSHCCSHPLIDSSFLSSSNHPYSCLLCLLWGCGSRQCIGSSRGFLHYTFVNPSSQWSFCTHSFALTTMYKPVQSVQCPLSTEAYLVDSTTRALREQGLQCTGSWVPQSLSERFHSQVWTMGSYRINFSQKRCDLTEIVLEQRTRYLNGLSTFFQEAI